ncbi:MAG: type II secretion system protein [Longimicrobiales bacterium]|nr:type II secretion system protein [Longimicrobiales bacterium]
MKISLHPGTTRPDARGFTLIELVVVVTIISLLAALAQPQLKRVLLRAKAAAAVAELNAVKTALQSYESEFLRFPPESGVGVVPPGLEPFLPDGFTFTRDDYVMDYDNWLGPNGQPQTPGTFSVGLTIVPNDVTLGEAMVANSGDAIFELNGRFTWILFE